VYPEFLLWEAGGSLIYEAPELKHDSRKGIELAGAAFYPYLLDNATVIVSQGKSKKSSPTSRGGRGV
tara:strand:- start:534 stop:734 length:201 start_codon:yes stop_codon:yes gene_type:complete